MITGNMIYFAYGSNMCPKQMSKRCPGGEALGTAELHGWQFLINSRSYATIEAKVNSITHGVLWSLTTDHITILDEYEAVAEGMYYKKEMKVLREGKSIEALVYFDPVCEKGLPKTKYIRSILDGAKYFNLPTGYIVQLEKEWGKLPD